MHVRTKRIFFLAGTAITLFSGHFATKHGSWCTLGASPEMDALLGHTAAALRTTNVSFWVTGGTALGLARSGELIPHDDDVDMCIEERVSLNGSAFAAFNVVHWNDNTRYATLRRGNLQADIHVCRSVSWGNRGSVYPARWPIAWHQEQSKDEAVCQYTSRLVPKYNAAFPYRCALRGLTLPPASRHFGMWSVPVAYDERHYCHSLYGDSAFSKLVTKQATGVDRLVVCLLPMRAWQAATVTGLVSLGVLFRDLFNRGSTMLY